VLSAHQIVSRWFNDAVSLTVHLHGEARFVATKSTTTEKHTDALDERDLYFNRGNGTGHSYVPLNIVLSYDRTQVTFTGRWWCPIGEGCVSLIGYYGVAHVVLLKKGENRAQDNPEEVLDALADSAPDLRYEAGYADATRELSGIISEFYTALKAALDAIDGLALSRNDEESYWYDMPLGDGRALLEREDHRRTR
jgi:hypothetical protein